MCLSEKEKNIHDIYPETVYELWVIVDGINKIVIASELIKLS